ncbi:hypothetical protein ADK52_12170 [Streptomyces sp. WM6372]|uniref:hypothetical protein n=1 Tax=Streptomyces TaxID=1883 RepID=UPI0004C8DF3F|nr:MULTISPECIES: hypothetical protein [Streptomyces]KOU25380.1 hypothetical protein ADK52_12170 [Streptomyces sp. WM6372]GLV99151.1 hypothetical protein Slala05_27830 [Streptomyces lavendulae subsp. lavendulae]
MITSGTAAARTAAGLAYVCGNLAELRGTLGADPSGPLPRLEAVIRTGPAQGGPDLAALLDDVHSALQVAGDALGVYGQSDFRGVDAAGVESLEIVYRCPLRVCNGRDEDEITEFPARCSVSGRELPREALD